jgi:hypothetical protein
MLTKTADECITGDALILLQHAELKDIGLNSVGHRLTILKAVYETKIKQNVPIEPDHYIPLCTNSPTTPPVRILTTTQLQTLQRKMHRPRKTTSPR